jgi:general secretion pathway protein E/type IV pilus assembly protein PilB
MIEEQELSIETGLKQTISAEQAWHYNIIPRSSVDGELEFYADEKTANGFLEEELEMLFGKKIVFHLLPSDIIQKALSRHYRKTDPERSQKTKHLVNIESDDFLISIVKEANEINCSDIHFEAFEEKCRIRFRIDGKLIERYIISKLEYPALINKVKIKANLDIAEKRLPQDGRIFFDTGVSKFDIRVSVLPTLHGEKIVLRLLSRQSIGMDITELGFSENQLQEYLEGIKKTSGIVLISGPTGSGKTTTLYATLRIINKEESNILTIEDPIEYTLEGINQVQLKESIGLTFTSALRTFLRQDPDIIMLGEIRDKDTAQMAIRAALTGHLVLSTIHTNSAWGTVSRLADMGVPSFLLSGTLNLTIAQRLVRLLCPKCRKEVEFNVKEFPRNYKPPYLLSKIYEADGCGSCYYTGYKGRKAVYELIPVDSVLQDKIKNSEFDVLEYLHEKDIKTLADQAFELIAEGKTTISEVYPILLNSEF